MNKVFNLYLFFTLLIFGHALSAKTLVIAHRGGTGYFPEHTFSAKAYAIAKGADYIEQDVAMTKDNKLIVIHDILLDRITDVKKKFPKKKRKDGHYYVIDFTYKQIRKLNLQEGVDDDGNQIYKNRFPSEYNIFKIHTLEDELKFVRGMEKSTNKSIGIYTEIKHPAFHRYYKHDISLAVLKMLKKYGYTSKFDKIYLQTFDFNELKRIKTVLYKKLDMDLPLVQLMAKTSWGEIKAYYKNKKPKVYNFDWMETKKGLKKISKYADGIGPWYPMIVDDSSTINNIKLTNLVKWAHSYNMVVHPYTFRKEGVPAYAKNFKDYINIFVKKAKIDGFFTDFPSDIVQILKN